MILLIFATYYIHFYHSLLEKWSDLLNIMITAFTKESTTAGAKVQWFKSQAFSAQCTDDWMHWVIFRLKYVVRNFLCNIYLLLYMYLCFKITLKQSFNQDAVIKELMI